MQKYVFGDWLVYMNSASTKGSPDSDYVKFFKDVDSMFDDVHFPGYASSHKAGQSISSHLQRCVAQPSEARWENWGRPPDECCGAKGSSFWNLAACCQNFLVLVVLWSHEVKNKARKQE